MNVEGGQAHGVAVTGMGLVTPIGRGVAECQATLLAGRHGLTSEEFDGQVRMVGRVDCSLPDISEKTKRRTDRFLQFALQAAVDAVRDARLGSPLATRCGVFIGTGFGGLNTILAQSQTYLERGPRRVSPFLVPAAIGNSAAAAVSEHFGIHGPTLTYTTACAAGAMAIGEAYRRIRSGELELAIVGGSEASIAGLSIAGFANARALAPTEETARPFAADRRGFVMGEGAAVLVLENQARARERRARIYAEIVGYGTTADAHHITEPDPIGKGAEFAVRAALAEADIAADWVDYVNAHATGTTVGDRAESAMIERVLGQGATAPWVSSTKGSTGHLLGAAGALESAICAMALHSGIVPANVPVTEPAQDCPVKLVPLGMQLPLRYVLNHAFGFGGVNVALVLKAAELGVDGPPQRKRRRTKTA